MMPALPIDFDAIRAGLVATVQAATGLDQNHVVMLEAEDTLSPRPSLPYIGLKFTTVAATMGRDVFVPLDPNGTSTLYNYGGQRMCSVAFDAYGSSHEQAYGYLHLLMARLDQEPTQDMLAGYGLSIWDCSAVVDLTALLSTGFEGRAHMDCQFGMASNMTVDLGQIDYVPISGVVDTLSDTPVTISEQVTLNEA